MPVNYEWTDSSWNHNCWSVCFITHTLYLYISIFWVRQNSKWLLFIYLFVCLFVVSCPRSSGWCGDEYRHSQYRHGIRSKYGKCSIITSHFHNSLPLLCCPHSSSPHPTPPAARVSGGNTHPKTPGNPPAPFLLMQFSSTIFSYNNRPVYSSNPKSLFILINV